MHRHCKRAALVFCLLTGAVAFGGCSHSDAPDAGAASGAPQPANAPRPAADVQKQVDAVKNNTSIPEDKKAGIIASIQSQAASSSAPPKQ